MSARSRALNPIVSSAAPWTCSFILGPFFCSMRHVTRHSTGWWPSGWVSWSRVRYMHSQRWSCSAFSAAYWVHGISCGDV